MRGPTRKLAVRTAEWLEDPPKPHSEASFDERYAALLFRAFLAVLALTTLVPARRATQLQAADTLRAD